MFTLSLRRDFGHLNSIGSFKDFWNWTKLDYFILRAGLETVGTRVGTCGLNIKLLSQVLTCELLIPSLWCYLGRLWDLLGVGLTGEVHFWRWALTFMSWPHILLSLSASCVGMVCSDTFLAARRVSPSCCHASPAMISCLPSGTVSQGKRFLPQLAFCQGFQSWQQTSNYYNNLSHNGSNISRRNC